MNKFAIVWMSLLIFFLVLSQFKYSVEACPKPVSLTEENFIKYINCKKASLTNTRYGKRSHVNAYREIPEETQPIDEYVYLNAVLREFDEFLKQKNT